MSVLLMSPAQARRFWAKVEQRGECWEWTASHGSTGYGQFAIDGVLYSVHRISYMLHVDVIPDDLTIDHLCMNKSCVNPRHLEPVTAGENSRRAWEAGLVMEPPDAQVSQTFWVPRFSERPVFWRRRFAGVAVVCAFGSVAACVCWAAPVSGGPVVGKIP